MDKSIFTDKANKPDENSLKKALGKSYELWRTIAQYAVAQYPGAIEEWSFPGEKYGWSHRIKDKKRVIVYLLPRDGFYKVALVFGQKATDAVMTSGVSETIKTELMNAKPYAEGRGIRIDVTEPGMVEDIKSLIDIKIAN